LSDMHAKIDFIGFGSASQTIYGGGVS